MYIHASQMRGSTHPVDMFFLRPPMEGIEGRSDTIRITATLRREEDRYLFTGHLATSVGLACALCNSVSQQVVELDFSLRYGLTGRTGSPSVGLPEDHELTTEECDMAELDDQGRIDLTRFSKDQIYLSLPLQPRCRRDCRGLCSLCGTDLNNGTCACTLPVSDPHLAALAQLRNRF